METKIILLLLFALRTVSAQLMNIPPAPILPNLDISSFPEYMQRLLQANRPHTNNVESEPTYVPQPLRRPRTYGMNLRGDTGEVWNDINGKHLYVNDFAPSKSIHPNLLHNKEDEPYNFGTTNDNKPAIRKQNNDDNRRELPSVTTVKPENVEATPKIAKEKIPAILEVPKDININDSYYPSIPDLKSVLLYYTPQTLPEEVPANVEVQKDNRDVVNHNDDSHQNIPSISTLGQVVHTTPKPLEEIHTIAGQQDNSEENSTEKEDSPDITKESIGNTYAQDKIEQSFDEINKKEDSSDITKESIGNTNAQDKIEQSFDEINTKIGSNKKNRNNQSSKTYGMDLTGDHGYVWNDLIEPGIHYNVGELETSDTNNPTTEEEINPSGKLIGNPNMPKGTTSSEEEGQFDLDEDFTAANGSEDPSTEKTTPETPNINPTNVVNTFRRWNEDKPFGYIRPELDDSLKKYIKKIVQQEVAKQLEKDHTNTNTYINHSSENNNSADLEAKKDEDNKDSTNGHNTYGSITGNGKVTNIFVFYPNDKKMQSIVDDDTILSKPVNEILNDMLNKNTNKQDLNVPIASEPIKLPDMTITAQPNQYTNPINSIYTGIDKYKENESTEQSTTATSEVENVAIDEGTQTAQTVAAVQDDTIKNNTSESSTITAVDTSIEDIKANATVTESLTDPNINSPEEEIGNNNATTNISNEEIELTKNAEESNNTNDFINSSIDTLEADRNNNLTQATPTISNEDAELTNISTNTEDSNDNVTSEGTLKTAADVTTETNVEDSIDTISESSDVSLPASNA